MTNFKKDIIDQFAKNATEKGFIVYVCQSPHYSYACFSHPEHTNRVAYVQYNRLGDGILGFSGLYKPHRSGGSGWQIEETNDLNLSKDRLMQILTAGVPRWASTNYTLETLNSYLNRSKHSNYKLFGLGE